MNTAASHMGCENIQVAVIEEITEKFDITGVAISRHLSVLKDADLVRDSRDGKHIYYELNASVLEEVLLWLSALKGEN